MLVGLQRGGWCELSETQHKVKCVQSFWRVHSCLTNPRTRRERTLRRRAEQQRRKRSSLREPGRKIAIYTTGLAALDDRHCGQPPAPRSLPCQGEAPQCEPLVITLLCGHTCHETSVD